MQGIAEKTGANQNVPAGSLVISQDSNPTNLVIVHKGQVAVRSLNSQEEGGDPLDAKNSKLLYVINGPSVVGADCLTLGQAYPYIAIASQPCVISCYASTADSLLKIFASKPNIAVLMLRSIFKSTLDLYNRLNSANAFQTELQKDQVALGLGYSVVAPAKFKEATEQQGNENFGADHVLDHAREILEQFNDKGGNVDSPLNAGFFGANHSALLGHDYSSEISIERDDLSYFRMFVSLDAAIHTAICQKNPAFYLLTCQKISRMIIALYSDINVSYEKCYSNCSAILEGQFSWLEKVVFETELFSQNMTTIPHGDIYAIAEYTAQVVATIEEKYRTTWGQRVGVDITAPKGKLEAFLKQAPEVEEAATDQAAASGSDSAQYLEELKGSAKKIFQWASIDNEKFVEFQKLMTTLKGLKNPLDHEGEARKTRRALNNIFWEVYETAIMKYVKSTEDLPLYMKLFFNNAFLDETMLEENQILHICQNIDQKESRYPIYTPLQWLTKIYAKEVPTSVNELGLTFFEILKQDNRNEKWKRESDLPKEVDTGEARLKFEIKNFFQSTVKLTSGSIMSHLAILTKYQITQSIERSIASVDTITKQIDNVLSVDFSAFHREVLYDADKASGIKREFIQAQIVPRIILVPSTGPVFQFWQDREGKDRSSPGRLVCPTLAMADLSSMLLSAVGALRWETTKTVLGTDWNNISKSSLTADYTDYVQFYKKNRDLSPEIKEKLGAEFKRFRDDRARFVHDYTTWIRFESDGTQRFNKVCRKIFAKHIPFAKEMREKLLKLPSYTDIIQKSINVRKRKAHELEPRYKKYRQNNGGVLPVELEETFKFFNMET